jgi:hypothetical protein
MEIKGMKCATCENEAGEYLHCEQCYGKLESKKEAEVQGLPS